GLPGPGRRRDAGDPELRGADPRSAARGEREEVHRARHERGRGGLSRKGAVATDVRPDRLREDPDLAGRLGQAFRFRRLAREGQEGARTMTRLIGLVLAAPLAGFALEAALGAGHVHFPLRAWGYTLVVAGGATAVAAALGVPVGVTLAHSRSRAL